MRSIGELATESGCSVQTIRWYEQSGLLPQAARSAGGRRVYGVETAARLGFIRHARELGFPLDAIRELLSLTARPEAGCEPADAVAAGHLAEIDAKIARLTTLRAEVAGMLERCRGGTVARCRVIEVLADHSHGRCLTGHHEPPATALVARAG